MLRLSNIQYLTQQEVFVFLCLRKKAENVQVIR